MSGAGAADAAGGAPSRPLLPVVALLALVIAANAFLPALGARPRILVLLAVLVLFAGCMRSRRPLAAHLRQWRLPALFAASLLVVLALGSIPSGFSPYRSAGAIASLLIGWSVLIWLLPHVPAPEHPAVVDHSDGRLSRWPVAAVIAAGFIIATVVHYLAVGGFVLVQDEVLYLLQSSWLSLARFSLPIEPAFAEFFVLPGTAYDNGRMYTQYPPGYPAVLAAFRAVGLEWWSTPLLAALSILLGALLARRLAGERAALFAAVLLAVNPWFLVAYAGYMAHVVTIPCALAAALLLRDAETVNGPAALVRALAAGSLIGLILATRPLSGIGVGVTLLAWVAARHRFRLRPIALSAGALAFGGTLPVALTLYYNAQTTGSPLSFGYDVVHQGLHALGFGQRGFLQYDSDLNRVVAAWPFTPLHGVRHVLLYVAVALISYLPLALLLPGAYVARAHGFRFRWRYVLPLAILPLCHAFYWFAEPRMIAELLPFVLIGAAAAAAAVWQANRRVAASLLALVIFSSVLLSTPWRRPTLLVPEPWVEQKYFTHRRTLGAYERVEQLRAEYGRLLLFVDDYGSLFPQGIVYLFLYNRNGDGGEVLAARDRGADNARLLARYPERTPILVRWPRGRAPDPTFEVMGRTVQATRRPSPDPLREP